MKDTTLCFLVKEKTILLGFKKRGFGEGKYNGFGGKVKEGESIEEATIRELEEEAGVKVKFEDLKKIDMLKFFFPHTPEGKTWDNLMHMFIVERWEGEPKESEEMSVHWLEKDNLPFDKMWNDDSYWMPLLLAGKKFEGEFTFGEDNNTVTNYTIDEVDTF